MSWLLRCKCDGCGTWKGHANSWLLGALISLPGSTSPLFLGFIAWDDDISKCIGVLHVCSDTCKQRMLSEHLTLPKSPNEVRAAESLQAMPKEELNYMPICCEWCGPHCHNGAEHQARVEAGDRYSDGGEI